MSVIEDRDAFPLLAALLDSLTAEFRAAGLHEDLCSMTIQPGAIVPADYGDCGGMAWVRLASSNPTVSFPTGDLTINNCAYSLAHVVEVGAFRAGPLPEQVGGGVVLPTDEEQFEAARMQFADMAAMRRAITKAPIDYKILGTYQPIGPQGGVLGGTWTVTVGRED